MSSCGGFLSRFWNDFYHPQLHTNTHRAVLCKNHNPWNTFQKRSPIGALHIVRAFDCDFGCKLLLWTCRNISSFWSWTVLRSTLQMGLNGWISPGFFCEVFLKPFLDGMSSRFAVKASDGMTGLGSTYFGGVLCSDALSWIHARLSPLSTPTRSFPIQTTHWKRHIISFFIMKRTVGMPMRDGNTKCDCDLCQILWKIRLVSHCFPSKGSRKNCLIFTRFHRLSGSHRVFYCEMEEKQF